MPVQSFPVASRAPAGAKPRHEGVPPTRLHAERHVVADGAAIAIRKDEEEHDRCHDDSQYEETDEDDDEYHGAPDPGSDVERLPSPSRENRTDQGISS